MASSHRKPLDAKRSDLFLVRSERNASNSSSGSVSFRCRCAGKGAPAGSATTSRGVAPEKGLNRVADLGPKGPGGFGDVMAPQAAGAALLGG
jgi:hypothetical protein